MKSQHLPDGFLKQKLIRFPGCLPCFQTPAVCSLFPGCHPFRVPFFRPQAFVSKVQLRSIWYKAFVWGKFPLQHLCSFPGEGLCFPGLCLLCELQLLISLFLPLSLSFQLVCFASVPGAPLPSQTTDFVFSCSGIAPLLLGQSCAPMCKLYENWVEVTLWKAGDL